MINNKLKEKNHDIQKRISVKAAKAAAAAKQNKTFLFSHSVYLKRQMSLNLSRDCI